MKKAVKEIGFRKTFLYLVFEPLSIIFRAIPYSPLKVLFLKILGAKIGKNTVITNIKFFNVYVNGFKNFIVGRDCFIGEDCLFDLADKIIIQDKVTFGERINVLTHTNVGYKDHPLQKNYPKESAQTTFRYGCFVGTGSTILSGLTINEESIIAAGSVVINNVPKKIVVAGVPAKKIKKIKE